MVGAAVAMGRYEIALTLTALNLVTLKLLWRVKQKINPVETQADKSI